MTERATDIVYGLNPAFEVLCSGRRAVRRAYLCESSARNPRLQKLAALLRSRRVPAVWEEKGTLIGRAGAAEHQGVVLEVEPFRYAPFEQLLDQRRLLLLDNIQDPHNVGAILRSAEVFGFAAVLLPRRGVPSILPSVVKASAGACEHLTVAQDRSAPRYMKLALSADFTVVALDGSGRTPLDAVPRTAPKLLLVVGGEERGVGQFILNHAHFVARIPQHGRIGSLNASVAAGIALHALRTGTDEPRDAAVTD